MVFSCRFGKRLWDEVALRITLQKTLRKRFPNFKPINRLVNKADVLMKKHFRVRREVLKHEVIEACAEKINLFAHRSLKGNMMFQWNGFPFPKTHNFVRSCVVLFTLMPPDQNLSIQQQSLEFLYIYVTETQYYWSNNETVRQNTLLWK